MAEHMYTYKDPSSQRDLDQIAYILDRGGIMAYPTDLNWAFACNAADTKAIDRIWLLKPHKAKEQPFSLVCKDISMAASLCNIDNAAYPFLKKALPGPYTILLERNRSLPRQLKDKRKVIGIRIPKSSFVHDLIERLGYPLATTSIPATDDGLPFKFGYEVLETYGHALDLVVDLGEEMPGTETTIVDLTEGAPVLIRLGDGDPAIFGL